MSRVLIVLFLLGFLKLQAQYISRSEPVPYGCPSVCAGGTLIIKVPQVQNFPSGTQILAQLSNSNGGFSVGVTNMPTVRYSFNQGNSWINGSFIFTSNVNDLFLEVQVPNMQPAGSNYTIRMISTSGYVSNDLFQCNGNNRITVTPSYSPLPAIGDTAWGSSRWLAHAYTWVPTNPQILNTPALIAQQNFFNPLNYEGYFVKNSLNFDLNYTANGGEMPGPFNILHDGTSFACGDGHSVNYCIRFLRKEYFSPGKYRIDIAADDGIRLSIDGGQTWLLNSFLEQSYANSFASTASTNPDGICLSGEVRLVAEYFQRPMDARVTVSITRLSEISPDLVNVTLCEGGSAQFFAGAAIQGASYQWEINETSQAFFTAVPPALPFTGGETNQLSVGPLGTDLNNAVFRCRIDGICPTPIYTDTALLKVLNDARILEQPKSANWCSGDTVLFAIDTDASEIRWESSSDGGMSFQPLNDGLPYSGATTPVLSVFPADSTLESFIFRARITGCAGVQVSDTVVAVPDHKFADVLIPNVITPNGDGRNDVFRLSDAGSHSEEILLYNRWGRMVFSSAKASTPEWNPIGDGSAFPAGVYYYQIRYRVPCSDEWEEKQGVLSVFY